KIGFGVKKGGGLTTGKQKHWGKKILWERVSCPTPTPPLQRRKSWASGRTRLDGRPRPLSNFCVAERADLLPGAGNAASARNFMSFWPATIALRRISDIGIAGGEPQCVMPWHSRPVATE